MRLFYFDDSGSRVPGKGKPFFVLAGFGIDSDDLPLLKRAVTQQARFYGMELGYPTELKFHHVATLRDNKPTKPQWMLRSGLTEMNQRRALVYSCLRAALSIPSAEALCVGVNKERLGGDQSAISEALTLLLERVQLNCQKHGTSGLVLMDEERKEDKALRESLRQGSPFFQYDRIADTIAFMPSEESIGIQIADLVAGGFSRHLNHGDSGYLRTFARSADGYPDSVIGRGLKVLSNLDVVEMPSARTAPWTAQDREVHDLENHFTRKQQLVWESDGTPNLIFPFDTDSK